MCVWSGGHDEAQIRRADRQDSTAAAAMPPGPTDNSRVYQCLPHTTVSRYPCNWVTIWHADTRETPSSADHTIWSAWSAIRFWSQDLLRRLIAAY